MTTNSITISQNLVDAGLELTAANAIALAMDSNVNENVATKTDLAKMEAATKADFAKLEATTKVDLAKVETEMKSLATKEDLAKLETRVTTKIEVLSAEIKVIGSRVSMTATMIIGLFIVIVADILMR